MSERLSSSTLLLLLHSLPQAAPAGQHLLLHLLKSLTSGSFSCCQSLVLPRLMVSHSWWRQSLRVIFMAPNFPHSVFDSLSCTETQWIVDKVMIEHSLHSLSNYNICTDIFPFDCSQAAVCPCPLFRVCCRPHSEGCAQHSLQHLLVVVFTHQTSCLMGYLPIMPVNARDKAGTKRDKQGQAETSRDKAGTIRDKAGTNRNK